MPKYIAAASSLSISFFRDDAPRKLVGRAPGPGGLVLLRPERRGRLRGCLRHGNRILPGCPPEHLLADFYFTFDKI